VAGKAPIAGKFSGDSDQLKGWILQMDDYFVITKIWNQAPQLFFISICLAGTTLEWWKNKEVIISYMERNLGFPTTLLRRLL